MRGFQPAGRQRRCVCAARSGKSVPWLVVSWFDNRWTSKAGVCAGRHVSLPTMVSLGGPFLCFTVHSFQLSAEKIDMLEQKCILMDYHYIKMRPESRFDCFISVDGK